MPLLLLLPPPLLPPQLMPQPPLLPPPLLLPPPPLPPPLLLLPPPLLPPPLLLLLLLHGAHKTTVASMRSASSTSSGFCCNTEGARRACLANTSRGCTIPESAALAVQRSW